MFKLFLLLFNFVVVSSWTYIDVNCSSFVRFAGEGEAIDEGDVLYAHAGRSLSL